MCYLRKRDTPTHTVALILFFQRLLTNGVSLTFLLQYEMLHVAPPCSAPNVLWDSEVSDKTGYVEVDKGTCQHVRFSNIFALGDCSNLPTSKTAAAISELLYNVCMFAGVTKMQSDT